MPIKHDPVEDAKIDPPASVRPPKKKGGTGTVASAKAGASSTSVAPTDDTSDKIPTPSSASSLQPMQAVEGDVPLPPVPTEQVDTKAVHRAEAASVPRQPTLPAKKALPPLIVSETYRVSIRDPRRVVTARGFATVRDGMILTVQQHGQKTIDLVHQQGVDLVPVETVAPKG